MRDKAKADLLLEWCSVRGTGTKSSFVGCCETLFGGEVSANTVLRHFEVAGHLEVDWEGTGGWTITQPCLVLAPAAGGNAFHVGARTTGTWKELTRALETGLIAGLHQVTQAAPDPTAWYVGIDSAAMLTSAAEMVGGIAVTESRHLYTDHFEGLEAVLESQRSEFAPSGIRAEQLNSLTLRYEPIDVQHGRWPAGCFRQPSRGRDRYLFVDDEGRTHPTDRWVATHAELNRQRGSGRGVATPLRWDRTTQDLVCDAQAQLPTALARAAVLCSGLAPRRVQLVRGPLVEVFPGVEVNTYRRLADALRIPHSTITWTGEETVW